LSHRSTKRLFQAQAQTDFANVEPDQAPLLSSPEKTRRSYFIRHWRGDLSLPLSYWVNLFLLTLVMVFISALVSAFIDPTKGLATWAIGISLVGVFAIVATVWQIVGVWRSAGKHKIRGGSGFWAGAARVAVALGFLSFTSQLANNDIPQ
jgi:hypothetical protein